MYCPYCRYPDSRVVDSRTSDDGVAIRRRRQCPDCGRRFSTTETASLSVIKRSGVVVPFSREKIMNGVRKACQGRPVTDSDLAVLAQRVEETVRSTGAAQVEANDIGLAILQPLRELDEVAYLRFASVYQAFDSLDDFEAAITLLRVEHDAAPDARPSAASTRAGSSSAAGHASAPGANAASGTTGARGTSTSATGAAAASGAGSRAAGPHAAGAARPE